jgi:hypothetical protein
MAGFSKKPEERRHLVGGNPSPDSEDYAHVRLRLRLRNYSAGSIGVETSLPSLISRRAMDSGFSLGAEDHQSVLRVGSLQQLVDRRVDDAFKVRGHEFSKF